MQSSLYATEFGENVPKIIQRLDFLGIPFILNKDRINQGNALMIQEFFEKSRIVPEKTFCSQRAFKVA